MEFVVLGVLLFVAAVIAVDTVRQRRIRAARAIDLGAPSPVGWPGRNGDLPAALATALAREQATPVDVCVIRRHPRGGRPPAPTARTRRSGSSASVGATTTR